jgi:hypothetical protein
MAVVTLEECKRATDYIRKNTIISKNGSVILRYPDRLRTSGSKENRLKLQKLDSGVGLFCRFAMLEPERKIRFSRISLKELGLEHLWDERNLWDATSIGLIVERLRTVCPFPFWIKIEVGWKRHLHVHMLSYEIPLGRLYGKAIWSLDGIAEYLVKPPIKLHSKPDKIDIASLGIFLKAKEKAKLSGKNLPRLSYSNCIPNKV